MKNRLSSLARRLRRKSVLMIKHRGFVNSLRPSDVFIVSYPKAGRNWVGFFLAMILAKRIPEASEALTLKTFQQCVPGVDIDGRNGSLDKYHHWPEPRVFMTHAESGYSAYLPKVVYCVRDPRDTMVSYHYYRRRVDPTFDMSMREFIIKNEMYPCDWGDHVASWLTHAKTGHLLVIRYEDLHADCQYWFQKLLEFCTLRVTEEEVVEAIGKSSFDNMRSLEERFGTHKGSRGDPNIHLIRRGEVGSWQRELSPELAEIIQRRYSDLMFELGYTE